MAEPELAAMNAVFEALDGLEEEARERVIRWTWDRFGLGGAAPGPGPGGGGAGEPNAPASFSDVADLMHAADASNGPERALVVGYWFQEIEGRPGWSGGELNSVLNDLGHRLANVTKTLDLLKARKPQLVAQIAKTGRSRQARKTYKLTTAGIHQVRDMLAAGGSREVA